MKEMDEVVNSSAEIRVRVALDGCGSSPLPEIYSELIGLLRSTAPLSAELRETLADALERGHAKLPGIRLRIEADGSFFKSIASAEKYRRLLEAGRHIYFEKEKGRKFADIRGDLPEMFGIVDAEDYEDRARKAFEKFRAFVYANFDELAWTSASKGNSFESCIREDDFFYFASSSYAEAQFLDKFPVA